MSRFPEFDHYDGLGLAELVRAGQVSAAELVDEAIARIESRDALVNAVIRRLFEQGRETVRAATPDGPFGGVPFLLKDLLSDVKGVPTCCGTGILGDVRAPHDSEMVTPLPESRARHPRQDQHARVRPAAHTEPEASSAPRATRGT